MNPEITFFLCPTCFAASELPDEGHVHPMIEYNGCRQSVEQRRPLVDGQGRLQSRAPRWFLEARGWLPTTA